MSFNNNTIYIVDGYGFIFRAFYAVPNLKTKEGQPIGAVYGFFKMLIGLINHNQPSHLVVALDTGHRTFRNDIYDAFIEKKAIRDVFEIYKNEFLKKSLNYTDLISLSYEDLAKKLSVNLEMIKSFCEKNDILIQENKMLLIMSYLNLLDTIKIEDYKTQYKANRKETPDELKSQFKIIHEFINEANISCESVIGFEADDVISSITNDAIKKGMNVVIVSADKDLCQLVDDKKNIIVYDPSKKKYLNEQGVIEKFGVKSNQVVDYLSIIGDHIDNVVGVNGIGAKGAVKLIEKYGSVENILLHLQELDEKTKNKFSENREILELAQQLIKLDNNAISVDNFDKYKLNINHQNLYKFIEKYGFKSIEKQQRYSNNWRDKSKLEIEKTTKEVGNFFEKSNNDNEKEQISIVKQTTLFG